MVDYVELLSFSPLCIKLNLFAVGVLQETSAGMLAVEMLTFMTHTSAKLGAWRVEKLVLKS